MLSDTQAIDILCFAVESYLTNSLSEQEKAEITTKFQHAKVQGTDAYLYIKLTNPKFFAIASKLAKQFAERHGTTCLDNDSFNQGPMVSVLNRIESYVKTNRNKIIEEYTDGLAWWSKHDMNEDLINERMKERYLG